MRERPLGSTSVAALLMLVLACSGCEDKKPPAPAAYEAGASKLPDAMGGPSAPLGVVRAYAGCRPAVEGGARIDGMREPGAVTVAIAKNQALIVNTIFKEAATGGGPDALETASAARIFMNATTGALESKPDPVSEPHTNDRIACCALTWAVATSYGDEPSTLSLGTTRFGAQGCAGGTVMLKGRGEPKAIAAGQCRLSSALAGAAHGDVAIALTDGLADPAKGTTPAVDAIVYTSGKAKSVRLESFVVPDTAAATERPKIDALVAAVSASTVAAAYRVTRGGVQELHVVKLAPDGTKVGKVEVIERGVVGTPTLAFEGDDVLHVVWATRVSDKEPYSLHWTKWPATGGPQPHQKLGTGNGLISAYSPALAIDEGRFLLAWTEGDKTGVVKAGASTGGMAGALNLAGVVSKPGVDAKTPKVAVDHKAMFVVWEEVVPGQARELRGSPLRCQD